MDAVLVAYNSATHLEECVESLRVRARKRRLVSHDDDRNVALAVQPPCFGQTGARQTAVRDDAIHSGDR